MRYLFSMFLCLVVLGQSPAQRAGYWQQEVDYTMDIDMDVNTNRFTGTQQLVYTNHSPDTLHRVFYHLYFNAFQPGSMMDVRSRTIMEYSVRWSCRDAGIGSGLPGWRCLHWSTTG